MQEHYTYKYHMAMVIVVIKLYCYQSEEELGQIIDQFWIEHEKSWSKTSSFETSYIWKSFTIKYGKSYLWHNMYPNPFTKFLGLVGCRVTSKVLGIGTSEINWKEYKHIQRGQRSRLQTSHSADVTYDHIGNACIISNISHKVRCQ